MRVERAEDECSSMAEDERDGGKGRRGGRSGEDSRLLVPEERRGCVESDQVERGRR